jgi:hypothetical protein
MGFDKRNANNPIELIANINYKYEMQHNYPNPFNPVTNITYSLPEKALVSLKVYDMLGREVTELVNGHKEMGTYTISFDGSNLASGMYVVNMQAGDPRERGKYIQSRKILLMK